MYKLAELHLSAATIMNLVYPIDAMFHLSIANWLRWNPNVTFEQYSYRCEGFGIDFQPIRVYNRCRKLDNASIHHTQEQQATILDTQAA